MQVSISISKISGQIPQKRSHVTYVTCSSMQISYPLWNHTRLECIECFFKFIKYIHLVNLLVTFIWFLLGSPIKTVTSSILSKSLEHTSSSEDCKKELTWSCSWWWLTGWRERFRPSDVDSYSLKSLFHWLKSKNSQYMSENGVIFIKTDWRVSLPWFQDKLQAQG